VILASSQIIMSEANTKLKKSDQPTRLLRISNFSMKMPDPIDGDYSEQPVYHNGKPMFIRVKNGPDSDPMILWYTPNPNNAQKPGLWMVNNRSQFDNPEPTAKAVSKSLADLPSQCKSWMAYNPQTGQFEGMPALKVEILTPTETMMVRPEAMKVHGRIGYNRAMNGMYTRGKKPHCGKSYYRHEANDFTIRWFETKWVVDWRGLHNDNIGAAVCKEDVPEPWMCTIPWRIYDGKARDKKWKFDQNVTMTPIMPSISSKVGASTFE